MIDEFSRLSRLSRPSWLQRPQHHWVGATTPSTPAAELHAALASLLPLAATLRRACGAEASLARQIQAAWWRGPVEKFYFFVSVGICFHFTAR
jgi:hypothetical protein